ncbi:site-2 protease family protein [Thiohalomonas denitrificans]|uniref:Zinc metalloprotease n=1 Tax=Thiohalomonas denitrificans TaxID=415747 RepID=A0A1G5Q1T1_9GAMM|nr:site-2 protease family protein [Thiohalomonas denitrificans]SCZ55568.1 Zn-dependent protease (includes SpoIVFB) [Thiohalomonas denitrificans]
MFGKRIKLFRLLGFEVRIDLSWLFLGLLVAWSLAYGLFPFLVPELTLTQYWSMAVAGVVGLLVSIVLHEFSHSIVARRYGMPIDGITLFIFGGVAEMEDEPPSAKAEFMMAVAGPIASAMLAWGFFQLYTFSGAMSLPPTVAGVILYLAYLNFLLAAFNVIPAFPLDGGRILRSILWGIRKDLDWATRVAVQIGAGFGWVLVALGIWALFNGNPVGGVWWILIGLFLRTAAYGSYRQMKIKERLKGVPVQSLMDRYPVRVPSNTSLSDLVNRFSQGYPHTMFPVVEEDRLVGCVDANLAKRVPRSEWNEHTVMDYAHGCPVEDSLTPDSDAESALSAMSRRGDQLLMIVEHGILRGTLSLADLRRRVTMDSDASEQWRA